MNESPSRNMTQVAPYPDILASLIERLDYRTDLGWKVRLADDLQRDKPGRHAGESRGLTLIVERHGRDTYNHDVPMEVWHYFIVPAATYDERSWRRWLFDRLGDVDTHERMEDFVIDGERPYAPSHGPGNDPYMIRELGTDTDRRTSFRGDLNPA